MEFDRVILLLSIQRALLGTVIPSLRMVTAEGNEEEIHLIFYYHGVITEEERELFEVAASEVIASFSSQKLELEIIRKDYPEKMPCLSETAYKRFE